MVQAPEWLAYPDMEPRSCFLSWLLLHPDSAAASALFPQIPFCLVSLSWWFLSKIFPPDTEISSQVIKENLMTPGGH